MSKLLQMCAYLIGLLLEILIIAALRRGGIRRFPLVFVYIVVLFGATLTEVPLYVAAYWMRVPKGVTRFVNHYWMDEQILLVLVFLVVISLIHRATATLESRRIVRVGLSAGAVVFAAVTFCIHYDTKLAWGEWMTPWTSNLNFGAAILDLALWMILLARRNKDPRLLMLSGGLGIQFTGEAIGESVRNIANTSHSRAISLAGGVTMIVSNIIFLYIWLQALRGNKSMEKAAAA